VLNTFQNIYLLVDYVNELVNRKHATPAQIALSWLLHQKPFIVQIPVTKKVSRIEENIGAENILFTPEELKEINRTCRKQIFRSSGKIDK